VFIGGGTPSLISVRALDVLLAGVRARLPLAADAEITMEANPGTVEAEKFTGFRAAGINRLSLGIQSFNDRHLKALGRIHDAAEARRAAELALRTFDNVNLDLAGAGYEHYETSAFARAGRRSKHNLNYWMFGDYLGIGAGAHSKISFKNNILRETRTRQPKAYLAQAAAGAVIPESRDVTPPELPGEFMMNVLRLNQGFDLSLFAARTGLELTRILATLDRAEARGLLTRDHQRAAPTPLGRRFLNDLMQLFLS
jgi:oxygen-independent coproporphyrinogen-3 oxidase